MPLASGVKIGPYKILAPLGAGGMGIVYRARDTRLNRLVAIKFLSSEVADEKARRCFLQEAKTTSSLNHPHILTVHEVGEFEGRQYLVSEFVDSGTLRDWAGSENRNWREAVQLLMGIADALACAHDAGILHQSMREMVVDMRRLLRQRQPLPGAAIEPAPPTQHSWLLWGLAAMALLAISLIAVSSMWLRPMPVPRSVQVQRITDFVGVEESPAISPDGKTVAFVARVNGRKQIWIRLLAGGAPLQLTYDNADHEHPRWTPDSSSLIYFSPNPSLGEPGTLWEVSALGGMGRRIASAVSAGDVSHDGRRIATFQLRGEDVELVIISRDGTILREIKRLPKRSGYDTPRWSPDDRWIAYVRGWGFLFDFAVQVIAADGGEPRDLAHGEILRGLSWLADSSGLVYSSSLGSTLLYPPVFNLRVIQRTGGGDRQLTFGEVSYLEPDVVAGRLAASRLRIQSDVWSFPVSGSPQQNMRGALRITNQTGQAQTPSVSPDGKEFVYLSDSGGHGNLWVAATDGSKTRQITFEHDPAAAVGVPIWSPAGDHIVFILTRQGKTGEWLVSPDGSNLRELVPLGSGASWSPDGQWLYYQRERCIEKVPVAGGPAVQVRCHDSPSPQSLSPDGSTLYYANGLEGTIGGVEIRKAQPESGPSELLVRVPASRLPFDGFVWQEVLSPDGNWLAAPLLDGGTTNLWAVLVNGGPMRQLTDFRERSVLIVRRISWSRDGRYIYAAVADTDADVVLLDGLLP